MASIAKSAPDQRRIPWYRTKSVQGRFNTGLSHLAIWIVGLFFLIPWLFIVSASLKTFDKVLALPVQWIPNPVRLMNYVDAVTNIPFMNLTNSLIAGAPPPSLTAFTTRRTNTGWMVE